MSFLKRIFGGVWKFLTGPKGEKVAEMILQYTDIALKIVKAVAAMTPNRSDDEIIALFEKYGVANLHAYLALPIADRGPALLAAATTELARFVPAGTPATILQTAIQIALANIKFGG
jgi:hypothetical protein